MLFRRATALVFRLAILGVTVLMPVGVAVALQQTGGFNEREVKSEPTELDKAHVWTLDFRFKDPRIIKVHVPGRGTRLCWYLWYQVINRTGEPRTFIPDFEIVAQDFYGSWHDEVLPSVQEEIKKIEDPNNYHDIQNSVTIALKPVPVTKASDPVPKVVTGVAIWDGSPTDPATLKPGQKDLSHTTKFKMFISGLSNGWVLVDPLGDLPGAPPTVRRKTLQLNFKKVGDEFNLDSREIQFVAPAEWTYRKANLLVPVPKTDAP
jgi:hypothetical protein